MDGRLREAEPGKQALQKASPLWQALQCINNVPVHEAKVPCVGRNRHVAQPSNNAVEQVRSEPFWEGITTPITPDRHYHLIPLTPFGYKGWDNVWRILQIGIERDYRISTCVLQPSRQGGFLTKVAGQVHHFDAGVAGMGEAQQL